METTTHVKEIAHNGFVEDVPDEEFGWSVLVSGHWINVKAVEEMLAKHECVSEAVVTWEPDSEHDNILQAYIVLHYGCKPSTDLKWELARSTIQVNPYIQIKSIEFVKDFHRINIPY